MIWPGQQQALGATSAAVGEQQVGDARRALRTTLSFFRFESSAAGPDWCTFGLLGELSRGPPHAARMPCVPSFPRHLHCLTERAGIVGSLLANCPQAFQATLVSSLPHLANGPKKCPVSYH